MTAIAVPNQSTRAEHISQPLSMFSLGYHPMGMVADQLFPVVSVSKENDLYYKWDKLQAFRLERTDGLGTLRADGGRASQQAYGWTTDGYIAEEFALEAKITDRQRANADTPLNLEQSKVRRVQDTILLDYELRVANIATNSANYAAANVVTLAGANQWNNSSFVSIGTGGATGHSTIEANLLTGVDAIRKATGGLVPNTMVVPFSVALVMANDPGLVDLKKYVANLMATSVTGDVFTAMVPPVYLGMRVLIPTGGYTTVQEGETATLTDVWGKNVVLAYVEKTPALDSLTFGYTLRAREWQVKTFREEAEDATYYRPSFVQTEKLVAADCGYLIKNAIA